MGKFKKWLTSSREEREQWAEQGTAALERGKAKVAERKAAVDEWAEGQHAEAEEGRAKAAEQWAEAKATLKAGSRRRH